MEPTTETLDWNKLAGDVTPSNSRIPYVGNERHFTKIAFDVFQCNSTPVQSLWILETAEDGKQYLVAKYEESEQLEAKSSDWTAVLDSTGKNITLAYKSQPLQKFASSDYGFTVEDAYIFQRTLIEKLSTDKAFVEKLLKSLPQEKQEKLLTQFSSII